MKNLMLLFFCFVSVISVNAQNSKSQSLKEGLAIVDSRIRSLDSRVYVRELVLVDFAQSGALNSIIGLEEDIFFDNGQKNDLIAGDGIYTSGDSYEFDDRIKYSKEIQSVSEGILIYPDFKHLNKLEAYFKNYNNGNNPNIDWIWIDCDIEFGLNGCRANQYGWCSECCFSLSNCRIKLGF